MRGMKAFKVFRVPVKAGRRSRPCSTAITRPFAPTDALPQSSSPCPPNRPGNSTGSAANMKSGTVPGSGTNVVNDSNVTDPLSSPTSIAFCAATRGDWLAHGIDVSVHCDHCHAARLLPIGGLVERFREDCPDRRRKKIKQRFLDREGPPLIT